MPTVKSMNHDYNFLFESRQIYVFSISLIQTYMLLKLNVNLDVIKDE